MNTKDTVFNNEYMPYIIRWGKFTTWASLLFIYIPAIVLVVFYDARPPLSAMLAGVITNLSTFCAWYVVDPVSLFPILGVPGLYMTYIAGNSKEIRSPAALQAMAAAGVRQGTPEGTIISALGISTSILISVTVMTVFAVAGNIVLSLLPAVIIKALQFLLPALFGAMFMQRLISSPLLLGVFGVALIAAAKVANAEGVFKVLPLGGTYAQVLICVVGCMLFARHLAMRSMPKSDKA